MDNATIKNVLNFYANIYTWDKKENALAAKRRYDEKGKKNKTYNKQ